MGVISALGRGLDETFDALQAQRSGLGPLSVFSSPRWGHIPVGQVSQAHIPSDGSRSMALACAGAMDAFGGAGLDKLSSSQREKTAVVLGACTGGMLESEEFLRDLLRVGQSDVRRLRHHTCANATEAVARKLGLGGQCLTVSDACASGASAIAMACDMIASGEESIALAGGVDTLTRLTLNGFCSLLVVADDGCRPFDAQRKGMSLGEGAAFLALESAGQARARGARIHGYVAGWACSCDAYHPTAPDPTGDGAFRAMREALEMAGRQPGDVSYVNAHGTGTIENDLAEAAAIRRLFGQRVPMVSSTKRYFGHALAAAGAIEAVVCLLAMRHQVVPANLGLRQVDERMGFMPVVVPAPARLDVTMSNSFGFGGTNGCLVFSKTAEGKS
jgi:3-oxoacyl-(acyl-carrier-protein) synthase